MAEPPTCPPPETPAPRAPMQAFEKQGKGDKVKDLHGLLHDLSVREAMGLSRADNARIDAWVPPVIRGNVQ
ncbi:hypothetical protein JQW79_05080 [Sulfitobacter pseudonitzschiae]|uniref:hypothetical protein n=2 Tax=Pseudosulfitobacter pseudonitzschiae TaxID=1402135 RepID=UPI001BB60EB4|nr:hypothetical protein [Pseudosulfitobacter pseudonitzschiae]MBM1836387.1 hypothetical protein [Pseudosulfitobacter pseudonitzschiae]MBM1846101.1 hypothetical protein [Pseudosulfitobacter pseudonitzschiae]MBM1865659.1 hypothetical protein [Pseudosulfitobacter pseudonitzschiae]MBM1875143.1 hypothetical protein [Pseudosulfitobacter pseudonitzschiae]MBM1894567.1 hypothetical protein [Pseudosulfitobacter pseudonitzschiae]